jgi:uncharacterized DUF497 family protein
MNYINAVEFEWHEVKWQKNFEKHLIDFIDAVGMFSDPNCMEIESLHATELRYIVAAANSDPDAPLLTPEELKRFKKRYPRAA